VVELSYPRKVGGMWIEWHFGSMARDTVLHLSRLESAFAKASNSRIGQQPNIDYDI